MLEIFSITIFEYFSKRLDFIEPWIPHFETGDDNTGLPSQKVAVGIT
jgi:hypothetical protein